MLSVNSNRKSSGSNILNNEGDFWTSDMKSQKEDKFQTVKLEASRKAVNF